MGWVSAESPNTTNYCQFGSICQTIMNRRLASLIKVVAGYPAGFDFTLMLLPDLLKFTEGTMLLGFVNGGFGAVYPILFFRGLPLGPLAINHEERMMRQMSRGRSCR